MIINREIKLIDGTELPVDIEYAIHGEFISGTELDPPEYPEVEILDIVDSVLNESVLERVSSDTLYGLERGALERAMRERHSRDD